MKKYILILLLLMLSNAQLIAQTEPKAGEWKTWFISSGKDYRLQAPPSYKDEINAVISRQQKMDSATLASITYWGAGAPGYRWQEMIMGLWMTDTTYYGALSNMLLSVAIYDATVAAWNTKYAYNRPRPFAADKRIKSYVVQPESPSYPCEHAVAAGVASTIIGHFFPSLKDSVHKMAIKQMESRIAAGVAFESDARAGFDLGRRIALKEIQATSGFVPKNAWDGKMPTQPGLWVGKKPMMPMAGQYKTVVLDSGSQFRPPPPPDFAKDMEELKNYKQTFRSTSNAYFWGTQPFWEDQLAKKLFEQNLHLNPPRAARIYALTAITIYDAFTACWDAKYTYWGIRPSQYDTSFRPILFFNPPFPGYPSGHAVISGAVSELYSYFFPADKSYFQKKAKDAGESRFQGGIHFRTDNEVGLELGRKVGGKIIQKARTDGSQ